MTMERVGGIIEVQKNGEILKAKGGFKVNLGRPKREEVINANGTIDYTETPQAPSIEGELTDSAGLDLDALVKGKAETITVTLATGKVFAMEDCVFAGDGDLNTEAGNIPVRWIGSFAEEIR